MAKPIYFPSPSAFGTWLSKNHASKTEVWVGYFKKATGKQGLTWSHAVDEALCWGWIDGLKRPVDSERSMQRFTPRRKSSHWSKINVKKVTMLEAEGRMKEPGRKAYELRTEENTARMVGEREAVGLNEKFMGRLKGNEDAGDWFDGQTKGYRRDVEDWVMSAKREETRERRFVTLLECAEQGLKVPHMRKG